jgi:hypothetical protein
LLGASAAPNAAAQQLSRPPRSRLPTSCPDGAAHTRALPSEPQLSRCWPSGAEQMPLMGPTWKSASGSICTHNAHSMRREAVCQAAWLRAG